MIVITLFRLTWHQTNFDWCQINRENVITIQIWFDLTRFRKDLSENLSIFREIEDFIDNKIFLNKTEKCNHNPALVGINKIREIVRRVRT